MKPWRNVTIDPHPIFGFTLRALWIVLTLCEIWRDQTAGLSAWRVAWAMNRAMSGVEWCGSTKGDMLKAWLAGESLGRPVIRQYFFQKIAQLKAAT